MATSVIGNSIISAAAFSIGGWLMSSIDKPNYLAETRRHNEAIERLTREREKFLEAETARKDHLLKLKTELAEANQDEILTNRALDVLKEFTRANPPLREPVLEDFYKPGDEMKKYQTMAAVLLALALGADTFFVYKYLT